MRENGWEYSRAEIRKHNESEIELKIKTKTNLNDERKTAEHLRLREIIKCSQKEKNKLSITDFQQQQ